MKLNIQLFAEVQVMTEKAGGSGPAVYYTVFADVTGRTATTVTVKFRIHAGIKSGSSWGTSQSTLNAYIKLAGTQSSSVQLKGTGSWGSGPYYVDKYVTVTATGISPSATSISKSNIQLVATRSSGGSTGPINTTMTYDLPIPIGELPINFNGSGGITAVNFNGTNIEHLVYNGTQIF